MSTSSSACSFEPRSGPAHLDRPQSLTPTYGPARPPSKGRRASRSADGRRSPLPHAPISRPGRTPCTACGPDARATGAGGIQCVEGPDRNVQGCYAHLRCHTQTVSPRSEKTHLPLAQILAARGAPVSNTRSDQADALNGKLVEPRGPTRAVLAMPRTISRYDRRCVVDLHHQS